MVRMLVFSLLLLPVVSSAEFYNCDGVIRDTPCGIARKPVTNKRLKKTVENSNKAVSAGEITSTNDTVQEEAEEVPTSDVESPTVTKKKNFMVNSIQKMNKACDHFYSKGRLKQFSSKCLSEVTSVSSCHQDWISLHAPMLGKASSDDCRNSIFNATNQYDSM